MSHNACFKCLIDRNKELDMNYILVLIKFGKERAMSLIEDAKNKNPDAFEQLIQPQLQRMYRVAISMLHNEEDAADAIQETVLKCWQKIGQLKSEEYFGTWLTRILINQCKDILKERKKVVPIEEFPELIHEDHYVDNIIKLGKFDKSDRESFLQQTQILVDKGFLNSFLVLSLLINIYKAERELPENKLELYQKCFEYISNKREKEKSQEKYDWALISTLMKDNTFMELANLCLPNNSDVSKDIIKERLTQIYKTKYVSENQTELAIDQFLIFCSDRTELFVPASGEDCFKFFHRSFFEYFYSQYIFTRMSSVEEIYDAWRTFDVDSEIFELTLAMFKQKNESKYQEIVEFLLKKLEKAFSNNIERINVMNMLVLCMQVIDDELYKKQFVNFIVDNVEFCNKNIQKIHNQGFIINVINSNNDYKDMVINRYGDIAIYESVIAFLKVYPEAEQFLKQNSKRSDFNQQVELFKFRFEHFYNFNFYSQMYFSNIAINKVFENLSSTDIVTLGKKMGATTKEINKTQAKYKKYLALKPEIKENVDKLLLQR